MIKIFVVTHKENPVLANDVLVPIQVGTNENISTDILRDNTLDNIADKNNNYCELTATYWIWKNVKDADYVGICHYRRYLNFYNDWYNVKPSKQKKIKIEDFKNTKLFNASSEKLEKKIASILSEYDAILCKPYTFKSSTLTDHYCDDHRKEDWDLTKEIIVKKYPEYKESIVKFLDKGTTFHMGNMMISSKEKFDAYYEWLFDILFELESKVTIPEDAYQARIFGFISERLINLYIYHNNFKIKGVPSYKLIDL
ncbi:uncharacterized protein DUF4422 [Flavobacterium cutihirudinis]|uniref:Uncharacterized protein DUF4422 n=1 Tax=Flavobacterium cutihirudinis TaxID=1265740 RepID=A0A3D9FZY7_9FLAO|nr:DUF4422 domain-containing protein [Flavobacterium cutihirudinis]RED26535.1 uncharacterized protein DUF4422 [Flavobacterium cutihirudinis]